MFICVKTLGILWHIRIIFAESLIARIYNLRQSAKYSRLRPDIEQLTTTDCFCLVGNFQSINICFLICRWTRRRPRWQIYLCRQIGVLILWKVLLRCGLITWSIKKRDFLQLNTWTDHSKRGHRKEFEEGERRYRRAAGANDI